MSTDVAAPDPAAAALQRLHEALEHPPRAGGTTVAVGNWRWLVRQRIGALRDALAAGNAPVEALREQTRLMTELGRWGPAVLETTDLEGTRAQLRRLVTEVHHHLHHTHARPEPAGEGTDAARVGGTPLPTPRR